MDKKSAQAELILRLGLAFTLLYPALSALRDPFSWVGYFPEFISIIPVDRIVPLYIFGVIQIILAVWILSGRKVFIPAIVTALMLFGIVLFNINQLDILFRDIVIAAAAIALALMTKGGG